MSKTGKRVLIALAVIALMGCCFAAVGLYAKNEMNKPKLEVDTPMISSVRALPENKSDALSYMRSLYEAAVNADDVEVSWHTDVKKKDYDESIVTPFSDADNKVIGYALKQTGDKLRDEIYPKGDKVLKSAENGVFRFDLTDDDVLSFTAEQGRYNDRNEYVDDDYYFITFEVDPSWIDTSAIPDGDIFARYRETLASAFTVESADFEARAVRFSFKVERKYDELVSLEITRSYWVRASVRLENDFIVMVENAEAPVNIEFPYEATEKIEFFYYGANFTQNWYAIKPGDWQAAPARVHVHENESQENFKITYTTSDPDVITIDEDGVIRVEKKGVSEETVTVGMKLDYNGHVYSDEMPVYITDKEVKTDE